MAVHSARLRVTQTRCQAVFAPTLPGPDGGRCHRGRLKPALESYCRRRQEWAKTDPSTDRAAAPQTRAWQRDIPPDLSPTPRHWSAHLPTASSLPGKAARRSREPGKNQKYPGRRRRYSRSRHSVNGCPAGFELRRFAGTPAKIFSNVACTRSSWKDATNCWRRRSSTLPEFRVTLS